MYIEIFVIAAIIAFIYFYRKNTGDNSYKFLANQEPNVIFGGRLADYKYYDMDEVIRLALDKADAILKQ